MSILKSNNKNYKMFGHLVKTKNLGNIDEPGVVFETIVSQRLKAFKKMSSPINFKI